MNKRKIAVIGLKGLPAYGGAATVGENIILQLKNDFIFTVYAVETHVKDDKYNLVRQIVFKAFPIKKFNVFAYYLKSAFHVLFFEKYDLVHLHHIDAAFIMFFLKFKYKVVSTNHGMPYLHGKWPRYLIPYFRLNEKIHLKLSDKVIVVSKDLLRYFQKYKNHRKVEYIPNGTNSNLSIIAPKVKKYKYVFVAGRIIYIKGLHLLLQSLQENGDNSKLLVIGDLFHESNYLEDYIDPLAAHLNVTFKDVIFKKELLFQEMASADFFIFPSLVEAMSTILLEAASIGIPIICSDIVQNRDVFTEKEVLFFKSNDINDLAEKIHYANNNHEEMIKKAENAKEKVNLEFNWQAIAKKYRNVYNSMILS